MNKTILVLCLTALASAPAAAQIVRDDSNYPTYDPGSDARNGYTAHDLMDAKIQGLYGKTIGDIDDLVIGPGGQLRRLLVDVNEGLLGTGGQRLAIEWTDVVPGPRKDGEVQYFIAPVSKDNVQQFGIFTNRKPAVQGKGREWRAEELIGDYVSLEDAPDYGSVTDLVFNRQGKLLSIALVPDITRGYPGLRFYNRFPAGGNGWDPGDDFVVLPYTTKDVKKIIPNTGS